MFCALRAPISRNTFFFLEGGGRNFLHEFPKQISCRHVEKSCIRPCQGQVFVLSSLWAIPDRVISFIYSLIPVLYKILLHKEFESLIDKLFKIWQFFLLIRLMFNIFKAFFDISFRCFNAYILYIYEKNISKILLQALRNVDIGLHTKYT